MPKSGCGSCAVATPGAAPAWLVVLLAFAAALRRGRR
jgi:MYXO-CTERM domain-containing protein